MDAERPPDPKDGPARVRTLIVDDHQVFRDGLGLLLRTEPTFQVFEAADGLSAVRAAAIHQPHVVVMDLDLPDISGVEATRRILAANPRIRILVLTMFNEEDSVLPAMRSGARGYLLKGSSRNEIVQAVRAVAAGSAVFGPVVAEHITDYFSTPPPATAPIFPELTGREREILALVADGDTNSTIARRLSLSQKTVRNYVSNIFLKLQVADRSQAIVRARRAGLGR